MVWINQQELTVTPLISIKSNAKQTGYIFVGRDFDAFAWKNDLLVQHLLAAMAVWVDSGQGKSLVIKSASNEKRGFTIEPVLDNKKKPVLEHWMFTATGYSCEPKKPDVPNVFLS